MSYGNFPGSHRSDFGIVINDNTDGMKLQKLVRKMAVYNPIPHTISIYGLGSGYRMLPIRKIIEESELQRFQIQLFNSELRFGGLFSSAKIRTEQLC